MYVVQQGLGGSDGSIWKVVSDCPAGDVDGDCDLDVTDLAIFVNVLLGIENDCGRFIRSDLSDDATVDGDDIQLFVDALL
jgi:hypothetical protein